MSRRISEDFEVAWHHVINRGRNRASIFRDDEDAQVFLDIIGETADEPRLTKSIRGPVGNPEKCFAIWAFRTSTHLTYRQIGEQLKMTPEHVARDMRRNRKKIEQFEEWADNWLERYTITRGDFSRTKHAF